VIDAQSFKTSTSVPARTQGIDAGKKIVGRKRSIITDTLGLLLAVLVTAAGVQDSTAGRTLLEQAATDHPSLRKVWVDGGYRKHFVEHAAALGIDLEIVQRTPGTRGFTPIPKRWAVERTYGWLMLHRRLVRDYETHPHRSEAMIHLAMTDLMARRLTGEATKRARYRQSLTAREKSDPVPHVRYARDFFELREALVDLYQKDGSRPYGQLELDSGGVLAHATIGRLINRKTGRPTRQFVIAFARACGMKGVALEEWGQAWDRAEERRLGGNRVRQAHANPWAITAEPETWVYSDASKNVGVIPGDQPHVLSRRERQAAQSIKRLRPPTGYRPAKQVPRHGQHRPIEREPLPRTRA